MWLILPLVLQLTLVLILGLIIRMILMVFRNSVACNTINWAPASILELRVWGHKSNTT
jgi:hypothetical protein